MRVMYRFIFTTLLILCAPTLHAEDQKSDPLLNKKVFVRVTEEPGPDGKTMYNYTVKNASLIPIVGVVVGRHWDTRESVIILDENKFSYSEETGYPTENVISPLNWYPRINRAHESLTGFIEWQNKGQNYDIKSGATLAGFSVRDLTSRRDIYMTAPWTLYFANASIATGYVGSRDNSFFPKRPANAAQKTLQGILMTYEITSASGKIVLKDAKTGTSTALYTGSPMRIEGKVVTCQKPGTKNCKDWPTSMVLGKTPVTVSYWLFNEQKFGDTYKIATEISVTK